MRGLQHLLHDCCGNTLLMAAFGLTTMMGMAGLATDTIQWNLWKRELQREADSAALAAARANYLGGDARSAATAEIARHNLVTLSATPVIEVGPSTGTYAGNPRAVRVILQTQHPLAFSSLFLRNAPVVQAEATGSAISYGNYCVVALEPTTATGVTFQGSAMLDMGCGIATNSQSSSAVSAGGSSSITASPVSAVGGVPSSGNYAQGTVLQPYAMAQADPFANLPMPSVPSGCNQPLNVGSNRSINVSNSSGIACFAGMTIQGTVNLDPGVYIINGGSLSFGSQSRITGSGVTFILTSGSAASDPYSVAGVTINGGATLNLTAPGGGTYAGVLIYQDRRAADSGTNRINGNSSSILQGAIYMPSQEMLFNGTTGMNTDCLQLVSRRVTFTGNSTIRNLCPFNSGSNAIAGTQIRLVE